MVFGLVGFCAGVIGTSLSNGLIAMRKRLDPDFEVLSGSITNCFKAQHLVATAEACL